MAPNLSPIPTCALNPDSPCPYPLLTGRPYTRTSCVRPLYAGPLARSHSAGPAFARHVTLRVESVSPHRPRRRCGMLYTYFVLVVYCVTSAVSLSFFAPLYVGVIQVIKTRARLDRGVERRFARRARAKHGGLANSARRARTPLAPARPSGRACERDRYQRLRPVSELRWLRSQALRVRGSDTRCGSASDVRSARIQTAPVCFPHR